MSEQPRTSSAWSSAPFRWTFSALTTSTVGSQVSLLAIPLLAALTLHASPQQMGTLAALGLVPTFLVSLPAGVWVDRVRDLRRLMIVMDLVRAAALGVATTTALVGQLTLPLLGIVVFLVGAASVVHELTQNAFVPTVVSHQQLLDANGKLQVSYSVGEAAGPGVGGLAVQVLTAPIALVLDAVSYLASAALLGRAAPQRARPNRNIGQRPLQELSEGLRTVLADRLLGPWARWGGLSVVFMGAFEAQYIFFLSRELGLPAGWIGAIAVASAVGAVPAAALITRLEARFRVGHAIVGGLMAYYILLALVPTAPPIRIVAIPLLMMAKATQTLAFTVSNVQQWSLRQLTTDLRMFGRVSAGNRFIIGTAETVGAAASGYFAHGLGQRPFLLLCACLGAISLIPLFRTRLWKLRRLPTQTD